MYAYIYELLNYSHNVLAVTVNNHMLWNPPKMILTSYVADVVGTGGMLPELAVEGGLDVVPPFAPQAVLEFGDCELFNCSFFTTGSIKYNNHVNACTMISLDQTLPKSLTLVGPYRFKQQV